MSSALTAIAFGTAPGRAIDTRAGGELSDLLGGTTTVFGSFHSSSSSTPEYLHVAVVE